MFLRGFIFIHTGFSFFHIISIHQTKLLPLADVFCHGLRAILELYIKPVFTCSKSTVETQKECIKPVQSQQQRHQNHISGFILVPLLLTLDRFHTLSQCFHCYRQIDFTQYSNVSIVNFEQVNASCYHGFLLGLFNQTVQLPPLFSYLSKRYYHLSILLGTFLINKHLLATSVEAEVF